MIKGLTLYQITKLGSTKFKGFADKINVTQKLNFFFRGIENIVGKRENGDNQHFLLFSQCFKKVSYTGSLKVMIVWEKVNS